MEIFRQRLLTLWAKYWLHHLQRLAEVGLGAAMLSGTVAAVVAVGPVHHKPVVHVPVAKVAAAQPAAKPAAKPPAPVPTTPAPAPVATTAPTSAPKAPAPQPIAPTQPSPGTGVKQLSPIPPSSSPSTTTTTSTGSSSSSSTSTASTTPAPATGGYYSTNWSGYAALSGKFTSVSGSWTVPAVTGNGSQTTADAAWVGIGGVSSNDLIQTGTDDSVAPDGTVSTFAFYELLPDPALEITSMPVQAGDVMSADITQQPSGKWKVSITDTTTGQNFTTLVDYTSSYSSAEWIEEDPSYLNGSLVPFDNFGHVVFTDGSTTMNGSAATIDGSGAVPITLVDNTGKPIATPSVLINSGSGFWVTHD